ncbi:MAG: thiamine pyrophosphate-dependent dehydrogenase E1 component subunit alpha [Verrucomicrobia bacterium]|nr:thiamine pyrophosphate-dependent dehydrogenase E1 component subunit alpha [Verrucomicrobiota bacterium]
MNKEMLIEAYRQMLRIRLVEERLVIEYLEKNIRSFVHFYIGQEAIAVGVCMNLTKKDYAFGTHRCHGHYLAKGGDLKAMVAELYGKATGCSGGRGGSMHLIDKSVGYMGSISILASVAPIAVGSAFALKEVGNGNVAVVFVGDGAADEGGFYESINLAALMKVPVLFVVENNLYAGMSDEAARHPKKYDLEKIVIGLGAEYYYTNGNDINEVYDKVEEAKKNLPAVLECSTYRHMAHSAPLFDDKAGYRKVDDLKTRLAACPLKKFTDNYFIAPDILDVIKMDIITEIEEAIRFAEESPMPDPETLTEGVYYE